MNLPLQAQGEMTVHGVETQYSPVKKVLSAAFSKEGHADYLPGHETTYHC